jgi:hypothetical protein
MRIGRAPPGGSAWCARTADAIGPPYVHLVDFISVGAGIDRTRRYTVVVTDLRARAGVALASFGAAIPAVLAELDKTAGLIAHGIRVTPPNRFTTYGAFDDPAALSRFLLAGAHGEALRSLRGRVGAVQSRRLEVPGSALPANWKDVERLMAAAPQARP